MIGLDPFKALSRVAEGSLRIDRDGWQHHGKSVTPPLEYRHKPTDQFTMMPSWRPIRFS